MSMQRISLAVLNDTTHRTFRADELSRCESAGECCKCGACCWAHEIDDMPMPGEQLGEILLDVQGQPQTMKKIAGEFCPHLGEDEQGGLACSIYGSPHKPRACNEWTGNRAGGYRRMLQAVFESVTFPPSIASIEQATLLAAKNVFALLKRKPGREFNSLQPVRNVMLETAGDVLRVAIRYVKDLSHTDAVLFESLGLPKILEYARRDDEHMMKEIIRGLRFTGFTKEHALQRAFVEMFFTPDEQSLIWA